MLNQNVCGQSALHRTHLVTHPCTVSAKESQFWTRVTPSDGRGKLAQPPSQDA